jgi:hypothetical protein
LHKKINELRDILYLWCQNNINQLIKK